MSEIAAAKIQAKIFIPASLVDPILTDNGRNRFRDEDIRRPSVHGPPQICHVAIAKDCEPSAARSMLPNILPSIPVFALLDSLRDSWLAAESSGGLDLLLALLGSLDRLCGQFAVALQNAEHDHLFLFAALIGTLTLVFPTHR